MPIKEAMQQLALQAIGQRLRSITGSDSSLEAFKTPLGDVGMFGPESMAWRVHAHFTAMLAGGLSSLIVQSLHPRALAAVWDHSDFRTRLKDRLEKTSYFVAATTYGSQALAMQSIDKVNWIHSKIHGFDLQGRPYIANEPDLIQWVHTVEVASFLQAYQHLSLSPLSLPQCDQYFSEMTQVGHLLGANNLPVTWNDTQALWYSYSEQLCFDERAQEILQIIESFPTDWVDQPFMKLLLQVSFDIMPNWVLEKIGRSPSCYVQNQATRMALQVASQPIQWMLDQQGVAAVSKQRVAG